MTARVIGSAAGLTELRTGTPRSVVMTMGALHDGHAALVREARSAVGAEGQVVVTVFVNPTQFGAGEDFDSYPRTLDDDVRLAGEAGADVVFAPTAEEVYGPARRFRDDSVTIDPGPLGGILEGASRPGHFRGVLTVVAKLMAMTSPDVALFGEKDYQQLTLIRRMVDDLSLPVRVVAVPTVREDDGLARSSRNRYLSTDERRTAVVVPRALAAVAEGVVQGVDVGIDAGRRVLADAAGVELDYLVVTDPDLGPAPASGPARALIALRVGTTRLIDNREVTVGP